MSPPAGEHVPNPPTSIGFDWPALLHELKQPLTAIMSNAQAAQRFLDGESIDVCEIRAILRDIVADDKRVAGLVRQLGTILKGGTEKRGG